jgi:hypothetical protein
MWMLFLIGLWGCNDGSLESLIKTGDIVQDQTPEGGSSKEHLMHKDALHNGLRDFMSGGASNMQGDWYVKSVSCMRLDQNEFVRPGLSGQVMPGQSHFEQSFLAGMTISLFLDRGSKKIAQKFTKSGCRMMRDLTLQGDSFPNDNTLRLPFPQVSAAAGSHVAQLGLRPDSGSACRDFDVAHTAKVLNGLTGEFDYSVRKDQGEILLYSSNASSYCTSLDGANGSSLVLILRR